jgi:ribosomal protein L7/L12
MKFEELDNLTLIVLQRAIRKLIENGTLTEQQAVELVKNSSPSGPERWQEVYKLAQTYSEYGGGKIALIKAYRELTNEGLFHAKNAIDKACRNGVFVPANNEAGSYLIGDLYAK